MAYNIWNGLVHVHTHTFSPRRMFKPFFRFRPWNFAHFFYVPLQRPHLSFVCCFFLSGFSSAKILWKMWPTYLILVWDPVFSLDYTWCRTQAGQIFDWLRENFYRHALEYLQPVRAKSGAFFFSSFPLGKSLNVVEGYEGLSLWLMNMLWSTIG